MRGRRIFDFLQSRGARKACPLCGHERWTGWDRVVALPNDGGSAGGGIETVAIPLTCANCGFVRLQSAHVLEDPRGASEAPSDPTEPRAGSNGS